MAADLESNAGTNESNVCRSLAGGTAHWVGMGGWGGGGYCARHNAKSKRTPSVIKVAVATDLREHIVLIKDGRGKAAHAKLQAMYSSECLESWFHLRKHSHACLHTHTHTCIGQRRKTQSQLPFVSRGFLITVIPASLKTKTDFGHFGLTRATIRATFSSAMAIASSSPHKFRGKAALLSSARLAYATAVFCLKFEATFVSPIDYL